MQRYNESLQVQYMWWISGLAGISMEPLTEPNIFHVILIFKAFHVEVLYPALSLPSCVCYSITVAGSGGFLWPRDLLRPRKWSMSTHVFPTQALFWSAWGQCGSVPFCWLPSLMDESTKKDTSMLRVIHVAFRCMCWHALKDLQQRPRAQSRCLTDQQNKV